MGLTLWGGAFEECVEDMQILARFKFSLFLSLSHAFTFIYVCSTHHWLKKLKTGNDVFDLNL